MKPGMVLSRKLFLSSEGQRFPRWIPFLTNRRRVEADVDIVIASHGQQELACEVASNYLRLEHQKRIHVIIIESSRPYRPVPSKWHHENISWVWLMSAPACTQRRHDGTFWASNGVALAAELGGYLGSSSWLFFSHVDMMAYRENFLSFLFSKVGPSRPLASFSQRHILPFSGGMLYDKTYVRGLGADWLPKRSNDHDLVDWQQFRQRIQHLNWIDAGEELILKTIADGRRAYVCASRGSSADWFGDPLSGHDISMQELKETDIGIDYGECNITRAELASNYPDLASPDNAVFRKSFDDEGRVVFLHQGRGASQGRAGGLRGDFLSFVRAFNKRL